MINRTALWPTQVHNCTFFLLQDLGLEVSFFLNRMLSLLRPNANYHKILLTKVFFANLNWLTFLDTYNGTTYYKVTKQGAQVHLDASLTGLGGIYGSLVSAL